MKTSSTVTVVIVILIVVGGIYFFTRPSSNVEPTSQIPSGNNQPAQKTTTPSSPVIPAPVVTTPIPKPVPASIPSTASIIISNFAFSPSSITVKKGTTITWTNQDPMPHTVTGDNGGPSSQDISQGGRYSYTFNSVGTFVYHCAIHPSMHGAVTVTQ